MAQKNRIHIEKESVMAYKYMWKNSFDFLGISKRKEYFYAIFVHVCIVLFLQFVFYPFIALINFSSLTDATRSIINLFFVASAISVYNLLLRRVRDTGVNPIVGFGIPIFVFNIAFMEIIIGNMSNLNESIIAIVRNPYPYLAFIIQNNDMLPYASLVMGFLKFITASLVVLLHINLILVFVASFLKSNTFKYK